jgi:hypothetical protein
MAYSIIKPGVVAGKAIRVNLVLTTANNLTINPSYVIARSVWPGGNKKLNLTITVPAGVTIGSTSTGSTALTINGFNPTFHKVTLVNNGNIFGKGGAGGLRAANEGCQTTDPGRGGDGGFGGWAMILQNNILLFNAGTIGGGGGGSGGDGATTSTATSAPYDCTKKDCGTCGSDYGFACVSDDLCSDKWHNGCQRVRIKKSSCEGGAKKCFGCRGWYTCVNCCTDSFTQWCPNSSGAAGGDGTGAAGRNGLIYNTGEGFGSTAGLSIYGINRLLPGSVQGTLNGPTQNS